MRSFDERSQRFMGQALGILVALLVLLAGSDAEARSTAETPYPPEGVWNTAVRFLRVDRGFPVKEKDRESGYILFEVTEGDKTHDGALEIVAVEDSEGRNATRLIMSIPGLPRHYESMLLERLDRKLREELGLPPKPPPRKDRNKPAPAPNDKDRDTLPRPEKGELPRAPQREDLPR